MERDTVGKLSSELLPHQIDDKHTPEDQMRESLTDYEKNIEEAVQRGLLEFAHDFYIVVITKKERLMQNVIRNYFGIRKSCPTPEYDQAVYKYNRHSDVLEFLWVLPSKDTCMAFRACPTWAPLEEQELLKFVLDFYDGTLLTLVKKLNNEIDE